MSEQFNSHTESLMVATTQPVNQITEHFTATPQHTQRQQQQLQIQTMYSQFAKTFSTDNFVVQSTRFNQTFTKFSKSKKQDLPSIWHAKPGKVVDIYKMNEDQYSNCNYKPKTSNKKQSQLSLQDEQELRQREKQLQAKFKFQYNQDTWKKALKPPLSNFGKTVPVTEPTQGVEDLRVNKAHIIKNKGKSNMGIDPPNMQFQRIPEDQMMTHFYEQGGPNFRTKEEMKQIAKCLILTNHNSPMALRVKNVTTLGRSCHDFLRVSKYSDKDYFEHTYLNDKLGEMPEDMKERMTNQTRSTFYSEQSSNYKGALNFGRIAEGLIKQHNPEENLKFLQPYKLKKYKPPKYKLTIKRQNIFRNSSSNLSQAIKSSKESQASPFQSIEKENNFREGSIPVFMTNFQ